MNKKSFVFILFNIIFLISCMANNIEPDLNYLLPTESKYMILLDNDSKKIIIDKCSSELKKVEKENVFSINDLRKYYVYEEKIGSDEFIWFISPLFDKGLPVPRHQIILFRKEADSYKLLSKYYSQIIWGEIHLYLQFNNILIVKGKDKAKGFILFGNRADIQFKTSNDNDGYYIKKCKDQFVGSVSGHYFRFSDEPQSFNLTEDFSIYPSEEWNSIIIEASDYLWDEKAPLKYALCNAFDGNPATSFVENTEDDLIQIDIWLGKAVDKMAIINGYAQNESLYLNNNRVKNVGGYFLLQDNVLEYQYILCRGTNINFTENYIGKKYNDTCIADINFLYNGSWLFGDINE